MYHTIFNLHADLLKAMSHPKRLEIIHLLRDRELCVSDIQEMLGMPQANLSQHLNLMRDNGVLDTRKEGKKIYYKVAHQNCVKACDLVREVLIEMYKGSDMADEFVFEMSDMLPIKLDPVCKMRLSPKTAGYAKKYKNEKYYFCAEGCLKKFEENPEKYIKLGTSKSK